MDAIATDWRAKEDRVRAWTEHLSSMNELDRYAMRCGYLPQSIGFLKFRIEMQKRRRSAKKAGTYRICVYLHGLNKYERRTSSTA